MQIEASSGQIIGIDILTDIDAIVFVSVDRPSIKTLFQADGGRSDGCSDGENASLLATSISVENDHMRISLRFRVPFLEEGPNGNLNMDGLEALTAVTVLSTCVVEGAFLQASMGMIEDDVPNS